MSGEKFLCGLLWRVVSAIIGVAGLHTYASHNYIAVCMISLCCVTYRLGLNAAESTKRT